MHPKQKIIQMMANAHDKKKELKFIQGTTLFILPFAHIDQYFQKYEKPLRPMTPSEEIIYLRQQNAKLEAELGRKKPGTRKKKTEPLPADVRPPRTGGGPMEPHVPPRDVEIPQTHRKGEEKIRKELEEELEKFEKEARPIKASEKVVDKVLDKRVRAEAIIDGQFSK